MITSETWDKFFKYLVFFFFSGGRFFKRSRQIVADVSVPDSGFFFYLAIIPNWCQQLIFVTCGSFLYRRYPRHVHLATHLHLVPRLRIGVLLHVPAYAVMPGA
jgi:hypothetical protein